MGIRQGPVGALTGGTVDKEFWNGRSVLVTGHTGFKGAWLTAWLLSMGARVTGYSDRVPTEPSLFSLIGLGDHINDIRGDVRDIDALESAIRDEHPDVVLHLAAQSLVRASYLRPVDTYSINVLGTANILEAVRLVGGVAVTLVVTSDKCYDNNERTGGYREDDPMGGQDPYSSSKGCAELVTNAYRASFFSGSDAGRVATARAGNVIGGGDWSEDRLVPDVMRAALSGRPVSVRYPSAVRPWQHVLDCLSGYLVLVQQLWDDPTLQGGWNFGPDSSDHRTVSDVVTRLSDLWPGEISVALDAGEQLHEAGTLALDCTKAHQDLGWSPRWDFDEALSRVVEWFVTHRDHGDITAMTNAQIEAYDLSKNSKP